MKSIPMSEYPQDVADNFLSGITFMRELRVQDPLQFQRLMQRASFIELGEAERVVTAGDVDNHYYFLLKGQLSVYAGRAPQEPELNRITPGQSFGGLSILASQPRTASIAVSPSCPSALLVALDLATMGALTDFSQVSLSTKLAIYRTVVNNTRWQLEVYKMDYPEHALTQKSKQVEVFIGKRHTEQELESLHRQVLQLTELLSEWNRALQSTGYSGSSTL